MSVDLQKRALFRRATLRPTCTEINLPWLKSFADFLDNCSQCGECQEACPERIIAPGDGGYPTVSFEAGACTFCGNCAEACPEKLFDTNGDVPWSLQLTISGACFPARGIVCQSCRDACDTKAINFQHSGSAIPKPVVDAKRCTGCGACVSACPADAIELTREESWIE